MKHHESIKHPSHLVYTILLVGFVYTLHLTLPMYVNSSFLSQFTDDDHTVSILYIIAAACTIIGFFSIGALINRFGNYRTILACILIQGLLFYGLITSTSFLPIAFFFIMSSVFVAMIGFSIDIFLEKYSDYSHTGGIRGLYMAINNGAWVLAPLIGAALIVGTKYHNVYIAALGILVILFYLVYKNLNHFKDPHYRHLSLRNTLTKVLENKNLYKLFAANTILNTFYAWMIIYIPIYLHETIGFDWSQIGVILTIMLLPLVIFQFPAGKLADRGWGEKKIMTLGFLILGFSTCTLAFITSQSVLVWAIALFVTWIGASIAQVMMEAYFFKKVPPENEDVFSTFRVTRYIAYICATTITAIGSAYTSQAELFIILGILSLWGIRYALTIEDAI